jgi:hypothetical protein
VELVEAGKSVAVDHTNWSLSVQYVNSRESPLGPAAAELQARNQGNREREGVRRLESQEPLPCLNGSARNRTTEQQPPVSAGLDTPCQQQCLASRSLTCVHHIPPSNGSQVGTLGRGLDLGGYRVITDAAVVTVCRGRKVASRGGEGVMTHDR